MSDDEMDASIQRLIDEGKDPTEMACVGINHMIRGYIDGLMVNLGHSVASDPKLTGTHGERLFIRALDELKARR